MSAEHDGIGYERSDVSMRVIAWGAIALALLIGFSLVTMYGLLEFLAAREARLSPPANALSGAYGRTEPPEPQLQADPLRDLEAHRAWESAQLERYEWIDRQAGVVRIPIERAMALLAARATGGKPEPRAR